MMQSTFKEIYITTNTAKVFLKLLDKYSPKVHKTVAVVSEYLVDGWNVC